MKTSGVEAALDEMDYVVSETQFGMEVPASIPAAFKIDPEATLDEEALKDRLESKNLGMMSEYVRHAEDSERWFFDFEVFGRDYKRIHLKMWPDTLRIYPRENQPELGELAQITSAIEQAMECQLHHNPIDREEVEA